MKRGDNIWFSGYSFGSLDLRVSEGDAYSGSQGPGKVRIKISQKLPGKRGIY